MATERIDIVITEKGSRVVKRDIREIGKTSKDSAGGVDFLKKALVGIGAALSARELARILDTFTHLQNRLRAVGLEGSNLTTVYKELLGVANSTRSSFEGTVELYSRLAISSKELGVTQRELIDFTKSLNQSIILSGASAIEAQAGLIQLSQGMASGTLRGDELRSVLEQLPAVADVIAKQLGVTRGELRTMGEEGKITANTIIDAFKASREELEERFGKTIPTISQSFQVLRNNIINAVGDLDTVLNVSGRLSESILALANNIPRLTEALVNLVKVLSVAGAAYAAFILAQKSSEIANSISRFLEYRKAIASGTFVLLGSAEAEKQKALATYQASVADAAATGNALALARAEEISAAAKLKNVSAVAAQLSAERSLEVVRLQAQISDKGRTMSLARLAEIRQAEAAVIKLVAREEAALNAVRTAGIAADRARATSLSQLQKAQQASAAATATAAGSTSLLGQAVGGLRNALLGLFAVIAANPITFLLVALAGAATALTVFRDQINLGVDDLTTLGDLMRAVGEVVGVAFRKISDGAKATFGPLINLVGGFFDEVDISVIGILRLVARGVDAYVGLWWGAINAVVSLFKGLPATFGDLFTKAINVLLTRITNFVNVAIRLLEPLTNLADIELMPVSFELTNEHEGAAARLGSDVANSFKEGFNSVSFAGDMLEGLTTRAREIAQQRKAAREKDAADDLNKGGGGVGFSAEAQKELAQFISGYDKVFAAQQEYMKGVELLDAAEKAGGITRERKIEVLDLMSAKLRDALDPIGAVNREMERERDLLSQTKDQRDISNQSRSIQQDLMSAGVILSDIEIQQLENKLRLIQEEVKVGEVRQQILSDLFDRQSEINLQVQEANRLLGEGTITQEQRNAVLRDAVQAQRELNFELGTASFSDGFLMQMETMLASVQNFTGEAGKLFGDYFSTLTDGFADAAARSIVFGESFKESMGNAARQALTQLLSGLIKLGVQFVLNAALGQSAATAATAASIAQAGAISAAWATPAALTSLATLGSNSVPAAAGIASTVTLANTLALPKFAFGGDFEVGGAGPTDSQLVAFRATPGESVSVRTPAQNRDESRASGGESREGSGGVSVINVLDPQLLEDYLTSSEGEQVYVNVIRRNADTIRNVLAEG